MAFQKPRILSDSESNLIRGKCLVGAATPEELMQLIGHFDLVEHGLRMALETLSGCMPDVIYVTDDKWSDQEPEEEGYETINFKELLGY
jgi:hypothetical protein